MRPETFAAKLLIWFAENSRDLPWKQDHDPYKIWISEIILQQTRVEQGTPYFLRFIELFPDIFALANAHEDQVLKAWQGLGYYSRARNLHQTAKDIVVQYQGKFPRDFARLIALKGIGTYTASAILSFAYGQKYAVVDSNVIRLVSRILGIKDAIENANVKSIISQFVDDGIQGVDARDFNQGMMDFGALVCTPIQPKCQHCPFKEHCVAAAQDLTTAIPYKSKKVKRKARYFHFFDIHWPTQKIVLCRRDAEDVWKNLYQLPLLEESDNLPLSQDQILRFVSDLVEDLDIKEIPTSALVYQNKQILTHRVIFGYFYTIVLENEALKIKKGYNLVERAKVSNFAFPKIVAEYINQSFTLLSVKTL